MILVKLWSKYQRHSKYSLLDGDNARFAGLTSL